MLDVNEKLAGSVRLQAGNFDVASRYGEGPTPSATFDLDDGTGDGEANDVYEKAFTLAAAATLAVDLKGGTGELNLINLPIAFTAVKRVVLLVSSPAAAAALRIGPQGVADAAPLWFADAAADKWVEVDDQFVIGSRMDGWPVTPSAKLLVLKNPSAGPVSAWLRVIGVK